jgi:hypothetical protein
VAQVGPDQDVILMIEVQSFLHTPGTPAPNKAASLRAS